MAKLTAKQELFCKEYLVDLNATQAAIRAGYSQKTASEMGYENLSKPQLAEYIAELKAKRSDKVEIDAAWVLTSLKKVHDRCMQEEAVIDREGAPTGEYKFEHSGANKALELIGKHTDIQAYKEKIEIKNINEELSDDELQKRIDELQAAK
ncbi:MAG: terminase small subunit [Gammaproteobacteria bacterium]|nr:terminase small subunit [Gammaproteobacteria bacterium]